MRYPLSPIDPASTLAAQFNVVRNRDERVLAAVREIFGPAAVLFTRDQGWSVLVDLVAELSEHYDIAPADLMLQVLDEDGRVLTPTMEDPAQYIADRLRETPELWKTYVRRRLA